MASDTSNPDLQANAPQKWDPERAEDAGWMHSATTTMRELKSFIAQLATSEKPGQLSISPEDVFLFPTSMNAIYTLSKTPSYMKTNPPFTKRQGYTLPPQNHYRPLYQ